MACQRLLQKGTLCHLAHEYTETIAANWAPKPSRRPRHVMALAAQAPLIEGMDASGRRVGTRRVGTQGPLREKGA